MSTDIQTYNVFQVLKAQFEDGSGGLHWALSPAEFVSVLY